MRTIALFNLITVILGRLIAGCAYVFIGHALAWLIFFLPWPPFIQRLL